MRLNRAWHVLGCGDCRQAAHTLLTASRSVSPTPLEGRDVLYADSAPFHNREALLAAPGPVRAALRLLQVVPRHTGDGEEGHLRVRAPAGAVDTPRLHSRVEYRQAP